MATCSWRLGCVQPSFGEEMCAYHRKVADGLITTTRSAVADTREIVSVSYPSRDAARRAYETERRRVRRLIEG